MPFQPFSKDGVPPWNPTLPASADGLSAVTALPKSNEPRGPAPCTYAGYRPVPMRAATYLVTAHAAEGAFIPTTFAAQITLTLCGLLQVGDMLQVFGKSGGRSFAAVEDPQTVGHGRDEVGNAPRDVEDDEQGQPTPPLPSRCCPGDRERPRTRRSDS